MVGNRSKRRRQLSRPPPPVHPEESDATPPVMWPSPGSGFEASPFSPAGVAQGLWRLGRGVRSIEGAREEGEPRPRAGLLDRLRAWFDGR
jgi:hypothetical protein